MRRSDVDAGPYRSRGVPLYVNGRGRWVGSFGYWANNSFVDYLTVMKIPHRFTTGPVNRPRWFAPDVRRLWRANTRPRHAMTADEFARWLQ